MPNETRQEKMKVYLILAGWHEVTRAYFDYNAFFADGEYKTRNVSEWKRTADSNISYVFIRGGI